MNWDPIFTSDLGEIQTPNLLSRNQVHYSVMLRGLYAVNQVVKPVLRQVLITTVPT